MLRPCRKPLAVRDALLRSKFGVRKLVLIGGTALIKIPDTDSSNSNEDDHNSNEKGSHYY